jgi:hypothetical protein
MEIGSKRTLTAPLLTLLNIFARKKPVICNFKLLKRRSSGQNPDEDPNNYLFTRRADDLLIRKIWKAFDGIESNCYSGSRFRYLTSCNHQSLSLRCGSDCWLYVSFSQAPNKSRMSILKALIVCHQEVSQRTPGVDLFRYYPRTRCAFSNKQICN